MKWLVKIDAWLDSKLFNGGNHVLYALTVTLLVYWIGGYSWSLFTYILSILFFYFLEVKQAVERDKWHRDKAMKFWLWKWSKKQDVLAVMALGNLFWFI